VDLIASYGTVVTCELYNEVLLSVGVRPLSPAEWARGCRASSTQLVQPLLAARGSMRSSGWGELVQDHLDAAEVSGNSREAPRPSDGR